MNEKAKNKLILLILFGILLITAIFSFMSHAWGLLMTCGLFASILDFFLHEDSYFKLMTGHTLGSLFGSFSSPTPEGCLMNIAITVLLIPLMLILGNFVSLVHVFLLSSWLLTHPIGGENEAPSDTPKTSQQTPQPPATQLATKNSPDDSSGILTENDLRKCWGGGNMEYAVVPINSNEGMRLLSHYKKTVKNILND